MDIIESIFLIAVPLSHPTAAKMCSVYPRRYLGRTPREKYFARVGTHQSQEPPGPRQLLVWLEGRHSALCPAGLHVPRIMSTLRSSQPGQLPQQCRACFLPIGETHADKTRKWTFVSPLHASACQPQKRGTTITLDVLCKASQLLTCSALFSGNNGRGARRG